MSAQSPAAVRVASEGRVPVIIGSLFIGAIMAGIAALVMWLRVLSLDETATGRTSMLVILAALSGFLSGTVLACIAGWLSRRFSRLAAGLACVIFAAPAFMTGFAAVFAIHHRFIVGRIDSDTFTRHWVMEVVLSPASAVGMFLQTGTKYFLPWPAAVMALAFTLLVAMAFWRD